VSVCLFVSASPHRLGGQAQYVRAPLCRSDDELCGLGSEAKVRHPFARIVGLTPIEYRRSFERLSPTIMKDLRGT
jgi:hypothetical protein